jgi:hypothetical protein
MKMDEGVAKTDHLLQVTRPANRHLHRNVGQHSNSPLGGGGRGRNVAGIAPGGSKGKDLGRGVKFLEKNKVWRCVMQQGGKASHGHLPRRVEGKEGEEGRPLRVRGRIRSRHLGRKRKGGRG